MPTQEELNTLRFFHYYPNLPLAIVSLVVYLLLSTALLVRVYVSKSSKFLFILGITGIMESIGYIFRILCAKNTTLGTYIGMNLFLLLPPNALALVNYKATGEMIRLSNVPSFRFWLKPKFVTWFFFSSDVFAFLLQGSGGGLQAMSAEKAALGKTITLVGLIIQLFFFASFAFITIHVHRSPKYQYSVVGQANPKGKLSLCLYITLFLLYVRSIYRIAEYAGGYDGVIATTEWAFYVFDTLTIAIAFIVYFILFIGNYLPKRQQEEVLKANRVPSSSSSLEFNQIERKDVNHEEVRLYHIK
ncbi:hypothetical protein [Parasitella parasitica]|uniref:RTA1 like protein n=1 Tax=Parasitella parasitica TaxID=35722 RepID=A0A0B7NAN9_9FUNG|nr:hypothetical protein [Parasitella parasitica]